MGGPQLSLRDILSVSARTYSVKGPTIVARDMLHIAIGLITVLGTAQEKGFYKDTLEKKDK